MYCRNNHFLSGIAAMLLAAMLLTAAPFASAEERSADAIIEEIVTYHGCYGDKADAKVAELFDELRELDPPLAGLWADIMDYWDYANTELPVNLEALPDDRRGMTASASSFSALSSTTTGACRRS